MNTKQIGLVSELAVAMALSRCGHTVLQPLGENARYDLAFEDARGQFHRVQCKTGRLRDGTIEFATRSVRHNARGRITRSYEGIEFFGVYCGELDRTYLVPLAGTGGCECRLRIDPTKNGQTKRIRLAAQFEI